jgi:hypothetical protein
VIGPVAKVIISVFIVAVLWYQWAWDVPEDSILRRTLRPVRRPLSRLGLGHTWKLFAPHPPAGRGEMRFEIDGRDGQHYVVSFPPESFGAGWGHPGTRAHKVRQSLFLPSTPRLRRSLSRWLVDHYLPEGPARDHEWSGPARVRCLTVRQLPPPLDDVDADPPPPYERQLFDHAFPAP